GNSRQRIKTAAGLWISAVRCAADIHSRFPIRQPLPTAPSDSPFRQPLPTAPSDSLPDSPSRPLSPTSRTHTITREHESGRRQEDPRPGGRPDAHAVAARVFLKAIALAASRYARAPLEPGS